MKKLTLVALTMALALTASAVSAQDAASNITLSHRGDKPSVKGPVDCFTGAVRIVRVVNATLIRNKGVRLVIGMQSNHSGLTRGRCGLAGRLCYSGGCRAWAGGGRNQYRYCNAEKYLTCCGMGWGVKMGRMSAKSRRDRYLIVRWSRLDKLGNLLR